MEQQTSETDAHSLSGFSEDFVKGELTFNDFIYQMLISTRFEMKNFIIELIGLLENYGTLAKNEILSKLSDMGYGAHLSQIKESSQLRNLDDILKIATYASIISKGEDSRYGIGSKAGAYKTDSTEEDFFHDLRKFIKKYAFNHDVLTDHELLRLHRLLLRAQAIGGRWGIETQITEAKDLLKSPKINEKIKLYSGKKKSIESKKSNKTRIEESLWALRDEVKLYKWQENCLKIWFEQNKKGVIEVVTGAGKTIFALAAIQNLKKNTPNLIVSIIVPTKALMYQWYNNLLNDFQMAEKDIGLRGDGHSDTFEQGKKIIIYIYNSAILNNNLVNDVESGGDKRHFLIVDECHRSGSSEFRKIYDVRYDYTIGLSATPEKQTDDIFKEIIEPKLGRIIFKYTFNEALKDGIIPPFEIYNLAINLTPAEQQEYIKLTDEIRRTVKKLKSRYYDRLKGVSDDLFEAMLRKFQNEIENNDPDITNYFITTNKRKRNLYIAENRWKCLDQILKENDGRKIILFHENIWAVDNEIYGKGELARKPIVLYHSGLPAMDNEIALELYRRDVAKILVSVKALIEGLDVPDTDMGIIVASSSSPTQRIQSMGRILRQTARKKEKGIASKLYTIYVKDTTDEKIFSRIDWSTITNKDAIHFELWTPTEKIPIESPDASKFRKVPCNEIDISNLGIKEEYPGKFEGTKLSCDHRGKVFRKTFSGRQYLADPDWKEISNLVMNIKPGGGVFVINDCGHVLIKGMKEGKLSTLFLGITESQKNYEHTKLHYKQNADGWMP